MSSEESEECFVDIDGKILYYNSIIPPVTSNKESCEISVSGILQTISMGIEMLGSGFALLEIGYLVHDLWAEQYWINFAARHIMPAIGGGLVFAVLEAIFKYSILYQQQKINNPELTISDFLTSNLSDAKFYLLAFCMVSSSAFAVLTSTAELTKNLNFHELSQDSISIGLAVVAFAVGNLGLELPWGKIFFEIAAGLSGFTAGRYLVEQKIMNKWAPIIMSSSAAVAASAIYNTASYCCNFWAENKPQYFIPQKNIQDGYDHSEDSESVGYKQ